MRTAWLSLLVAIAASALCASPGRAQAPVAWEAPERLAAQDGTALVIERGRLAVPEVRRGAGRTISLAVVRIRREGATPPNGGRAHIVLAGGPGDSGVQQAVGLARGGGSAFLGLLGGEDLIAMDQRGAGASSPDLRSTATYDLPQDRAGDPDVWTAKALPVVVAEAARLRAAGVELEGYTTSEAAEDAEALRSALGYDRLAVWGRSYGTQLAQTYAKRHPDRVDRLVLISPEGLDDTLKSPALQDRVLQRIAERAGSPDLLTRLRTILERLEREPATVAVRGADGTGRSVVFGAWDVQWALASSLGDPRPLSRLPAVVTRMEAGDYAEIGALVYALRARAGVQNAMKAVTDLTNGSSPGRLERNQREARTAVLGDAANWPGSSLQGGWGVALAEPAFREPLAGSVPVLMIVGDLDIRTPVEGAEAIAKSLPNARIVTVENAAHAFGPFGIAGVTDILGRFLRDQPVSNARVVADPIRFVP